jgi:hypothetical protein
VKPHLVDDEAQPGPKDNPRSMRQRLSTIMARALTPRAFVVVTILSHHEQWRRASFKIRGEEGCFCNNSLRIEIAR